MVILVTEGFLALFVREKVGGCKELTCLPLRFPGQEPTIGVQSFPDLFLTFCS